MQSADVNPQQILIPTERFVLRELTLRDVSPQYLKWLQSSNEFITSAPGIRSLDELYAYVASKINRPSVLFFGIFERTSGFHLGNLKYEPINRSAGYAVMGILIGETHWQGKGVAREAIKASGAWLKKKMGIKQIALGVRKEHSHGIAAYTKAGFAEAALSYLRPTDPRVIVMAWNV